MQSHFQMQPIKNPQPSTRIHLSMCDISNASINEHTESMFVSVFQTITDFITGCGYLLLTYSIIYMDVKVRD